MLQQPRAIDSSYNPGVVLVGRGLGRGRGGRGGVKEKQLGWSVLCVFVGVKYDRSTPGVYGKVLI